MPGTYVLMVDERYLQNPQISKELARYKATVEHIFGVRFLQVSGNSLSTPEQTRTRLQALHRQQGIKGAFLIGWFKFARFKNASSDLCTLPEFFEDLDGAFTRNGRRFLPPMTGPTRKRCKILWDLCTRRLSP